MSGLDQTNNFPMLEKNQYFIANCNYSFGGDVELPVIFSTNVDIKKLMKIDIRAYINFVLENIVSKINFGNYHEGDVFSINRFKISKDNGIKDVNELVEKVIKELTEEEIKNIHSHGGIEISLNINAPTMFSGISDIDQDEAKILVKHLPSNQVI